MTFREFIDKTENVPDEAVIYLPGGGHLGDIILVSNEHVQIVNDNAPIPDEVNQEGYTSPDTADWDETPEGNVVLTPRTGDAGVVGN